MYSTYCCSSDDGDVEKSENESGGEILVCLCVVLVVSVDRLLI